MTLYKAWKALERRHAKRAGGKRLWRPDYGESLPDGENDREVWDCKAYARFSVITKFLEAQKKYKAYAAGRRFYLVLFSRANRRAGDFILLRAEDYAADQRELAELRAKLSE